MWLLLLATSPHPQVQFNTHLINVTENIVVILSSQEIPSVLGVSVPETVQKPNIFFIIPHSITLIRKKEKDSFQE